MHCRMLLWPHANARYQNEALTAAEILREECLSDKKAEEDSPALYSLEQERMLPPRETLAGCGIRNGFRMILC